MKRFIILSVCSILAFVVLGSTNTVFALDGCTLFNEKMIVGICRGMDNCYYYRNPLGSGEFVTCYNDPAPGNEHPVLFKFRIDNDSIILIMPGSIRTIENATQDKLDACSAEIDAALDGMKCTVGPY